MECGQGQHTRPLALLCLRPQVGRWGLIRLHPSPQTPSLIPTTCAILQGTEVRFRGQGAGFPVSNSPTLFQLHPSWSPEPCQQLSQVGLKE